MDMGYRGGRALTRQDLRKAVYKAVPTLSRREAASLTDAVFEELVLACLNDEVARLRGFGKFKVQHKKQRLGRNPKTLKDAVISPRRVIKFVPSPQLIARINGDTTIMDEDD